MMTLYTPPFSVKGKLAGELLAPLDILVSLLKLIKIDVGFTLSPELKEEYGTGSKAILIDMAVSLFQPASLFFIALVLAVVFAWQSLIRPAIANNQPNPAPAAPISVPVIVPPSVTPTMTSSPTPEPTFTPTVTFTPTPTPIVFAREKECDPIPDELEDALPAFDSLFKFIDRKGFSEWETGPGLFLEGEGNWLTLLADTLGVKGAYALERAEWELYLDSNRYCQVNGQWMPLPPYEDLRHLNP